MMKLICSGSARGFVRAISLGLKQLFHDVGDDSVFAVLLEGLIVRDVNADPVCDIGIPKSHLERGS